MTGGLMIKILGIIYCCCCACCWWCNKRHWRFINLFIQ